MGRKDVSTHQKPVVWQLLGCGRLSLREFRLVLLGNVSGGGGLVSTPEKPRLSACAPNDILTQIDILKTSEAHLLDLTAHRLIEKAIAQSRPPLADDMNPFTIDCQSTSLWQLINKLHVVDLRITQQIADAANEPVVARLAWRSAA